MVIIEESDLDLYRYTVAKVVFLKVYKQYKFIKNIENGNCIVVEIDNKHYIISILRQPVLKVNLKNSTEHIIVYYQTAQYNRNKNKLENSSFNIMELNNIFDKEYELALNQAILSPVVYIQNNIDYEFLLSDVINNAYIARDTSGLLYKYYSKTKVDGNIFDVNDGNISFINPNKFNDPFDCSCVLLNRKSVSDKFHVLCTIQDPRNILMWSYYGSEHTGYCFEYSKHDIITAITKSALNGLYIIGKVHYSDKRPNYKYTSNKLSFTNVKFLIECTFTKYKLSLKQQQALIEVFKE